MNDFFDSSMNINEEDDYKDLPLPSLDLLDAIQGSVDGKPNSSTSIAFCLLKSGEVHVNQEYTCNVEIKEVEIVDDCAKVVFDFTNDLDLMQKIYETYQGYRQDMDSFEEKTQDLLNNNPDLTDEQLNQYLGNTTIPVMGLTILPLNYEDNCYIAFSQGPLFLICESNIFESMPRTCLTFIFKLDDMTYQDIDMAEFTDEELEEFLPNQETDVPEESPYEYRLHAIRERDPNNPEKKIVRFKK